MIGFTAYQPFVSYLKVEHILDWRNYHWWQVNIALPILKVSNFLTKIKLFDPELRVERWYVAHNCEAEYLP